MTSLFLTHSKNGIPEQALELNYQVPSSLLNLLDSCSSPYSCWFNCSGPWLLPEHLKAVSIYRFMMPSLLSGMLLCQKPYRSLCFLQTPSTPILRAPVWISRSIQQISLDYLFYIWYVSLPVTFSIHLTLYYPIYDISPSVNTQNMNVPAYNMFIKAI